MNYVYTGHHRLTPVILGRNEGQIKSYASCADIRAWSHDCAVRDQYLREWMKCDMPVCAISVGTLVRILDVMTAQRYGRSTLRCHPNCKARALLDNVCTSCSAMRKCLEKNEKFEKYFEEEEFETSQWPCERFLETLKNIKMFWKIIVEKVLNIKIPKSDSVEATQNRINSVKSLCDNWKNNIVSEASMVKNKLEGHSCCLKHDKSNLCKGEFDLKSRRKRVLVKPASAFEPSFQNIEDSFYVNKSKHQKMDDNDFNKLQATDTCCYKDNAKKNKETNTFYKSILKRKCGIHPEDLERLKKENLSLKMELQKIYSSRKSVFCSTTNGRSDDFDAIPKPFECCIEDETEKTKNTESETLITIKNLKSENFKHVTILQVLHKTNGPFAFSGLDGGNKENPIEFLNKVKSAFGTIVKKEMKVATTKSGQQRFEIKTTCRKIDPNRPTALSCTPRRIARNGNVRIKTELEDR